MKTYMYSIALLVLCISITCCSNDDEFEASGKKSTLLQISTEMIDSRAVKEGPDFEEGDCIGLWVRKADGTNYAENSVNVKATFDGKSWNLDRKIEITEEAGTAFVYAYYPYTSDFSYSEKYYSMEAKPGETDYMYGIGQQSVTDSKAKLAFSHIMSRLSVSVIGSGELTSVSLSGKSIHNIGSFVLPISMAEKPSLVVEIASGTVSRKCSEKLSTTPTVVDLLIFPTQVLPESDVKITLVVDGDSHTYPFTTEKTFKSGIKTTINLQCGEAADFKDNGDGTGTLNGYEWVDLGFGNIKWATCNVGAAAPEQSGVQCGWGDPTGEHREQWVLTSYGNYVKESEGSVYYGGEYVPTAENPNIYIGGSKVDIARKRMGPGWRMPKESEARNMATNCITKSETINGVQGIRFTSKVNGKSIFLPMVKAILGEKTYTFSRVGSDETYYLYGYWTSEAKYNADSYYKTSAYCYDVIDVAKNSIWAQNRCLICCVRAVCE